MTDLDEIVQFDRVISAEVICSTGCEAEGGGSPFRFTGEQLDDNGLLYLRARYYHPELGVFMSLDPMEGIVQRPMSLNGYAWVEGNTPNSIDPKGLSPTCQSPVTCPDASLYIPEVDYSTRRYVDNSYARRNTWDRIANFFSGSDPLTTTALALAVERARAIGNDDAARHLGHWMGKSGSTLEVDVDRMLRELPRWNLDIVGSILNPSITDLLSKVAPSEPIPGCRLWTNRTLGGYNPLSGGYDTWRRVGQGDETRYSLNIYSESGIDTTPGNDDFGAFYGGLPDGGNYTREEFDWFLAMNAFDYSISESVIVDAQGNGQLCYRIHIADEYRWYNVSFIDRTMSSLEHMGFGTHYDIRGRSTVRCEYFHIDDASKNSDERFHFAGPGS